MINAGLKIGILTYTREYSNLGTVMQCYCTLQAIRAAYPGAQVELIDYATRTAWRRPYLSHASLRSLRCDAVRFRKYDQFFAKELNFSAHQLVTRDLSQACAFISRQHYDAIYVGSDTVLELRDADKNGCTAYWLSPDIPGCKFLTAASSHKLVFEQLSDDQKRSIRRAVEGFCLLGLRDEATLRLVEHFAGKGDRRIRLVPDPTFTYPIDPRPIEKYLEHRQLPSDRPMVCLHLLRNSVWAATLAQYFRRAGYLVASLRPAQYADIVFTDLSPFEQMGLYRYFKLVITHRFHDVIFCLKSLTPVLAFPEYPDDVTMYGESKLYTLLKSFELDRVHYLDGMLEINAERLFDIHDEAITSFQRRSECTAAIAARRKVEYEAFIAESRRCVA